MTAKLPFFFAAAAGLVLAACEHHLDRAELQSAGSGEAQRYNAAVHAANPYPHESNDTNIPVSAERLRHAIERYNDGPPKPRDAPPPGAVLVSPAGPQPSPPTGTTSGK